MEQSYVKSHNPISFSELAKWIEGIILKPLLHKGIAHVK